MRHLRIFADQADSVKRGGNQNRAEGGGVAAEDFIEPAVGLTFVEVGRFGGIESDESCGGAEYGDGGDPNVFMGKSGGEGPDTFLIGQYVGDEEFEGDGAIGLRRSLIDGDVRGLSKCGLRRQ